MTVTIFSRSSSVNVPVTNILRELKNRTDHPKNILAL